MEIGSILQEERKWVYKNMQVNLYFRVLFQVLVMISQGLVVRVFEKDFSINLKYEKWVIVVFIVKKYNQLMCCNGEILFVFFIKMDK